MKIRILDAVAMGVELSYSDGDIAEVNYNTEDDDLVDVHHKPLAYLCEWENKYFEFVEETPKQKPWYETGELPHVGEVCEMMSPILGMWAEQWLEVEIIAIKNDFAIGWCKDKHIAIWNCSSGIRPLKSQEEILAENNLTASTEESILNTRIASLDVHKKSKSIVDSYRDFDACSTLYFLK